MNDLITRIKKLLWIVTEDYDTYLSEAVPIFLELAEDTCRTIWTDKDGEPKDVPGPVVLFIARAAEYNISQAGVSSESLGDYSISITTDFPSSITDLLKPYSRKVRFK